MAHFSAHLFFPVLRVLERCLPVAGLRAVTFPVAVVRAWVHALIKGVPPPRQLPACFGFSGPVKLDRLFRLKPYENRTLQVFPDRLNQPRWLQRCEVQGLDRVRAALADGRPVVLGFAHFGPYELLRNWTRAYGIPASTHVGGASLIRSGFFLRRDRLELFPEVPAVFSEDQLAEAIRSLKSGHPLFVALDMPAARKVSVQLDGGSVFEMPTGAWRLASRHGGELFACTLIDLGRWRYRLAFSEPVPHELLLAGHETAAGAYLLEQLLPIFRSYPNQCRKELLRRFRDGSAGSAALAKR